MLFRFALSLCIIVATVVFIFLPVDSGGFGIRYKQAEVENPTTKRKRTLWVNDTNMWILGAFVIANFVSLLLLIVLDDSRIELSHFNARLAQFVNFLAILYVLVLVGQMNPDEGRVEGFGNAWEEKPSTETSGFAITMSVFVVIGAIVLVLSTVNMMGLMYDANMDRRERLEALDRRRRPIGIEVGAGAAAAAVAAAGLAAVPRPFVPLDIHEEFQVYQRRATPFMLQLDAFFSRDLSQEEWERELNMTREEQMTGFGGYVPLNPVEIFASPEPAQWTLICDMIESFVRYPPASEGQQVPEQTTRLLYYVNGPNMLRDKLTGVRGCMPELRRLLLQIVLFVAGNFELRYYYAQTILQSAAEDANYNDAPSCAGGFRERLFNLFIESLIVVCCEREGRCSGRFMELCATASQVAGTLRNRLVWAEIGSWVVRVEPERYAAMSPDERKQVVTRHLSDHFGVPEADVRRWMDRHARIINWEADDKYELVVEEY
jgi:hypothetical protein